MHETDSCGEFIDDILNQGTVILYGYLPNAAAVTFKNTLMRMIQRGNHSSVSAKDVWETLRESIICHKCFEDYIQICEAHPPPDPDDAIAAFARSLPELPATDGPATVQDDALNEEDDEEQRKPAAEEQEEQDDEAPSGEQQTLPPWHYSISWKEMYTADLYQMEARSWLNVDANMNDYGEAYPSILIAALQGHPNLPEGGSEYYILCSFNHFTRIDTTLYISLFMQRTQTRTYRTYAKRTRVDCTNPGK
jgi:hypothetical protein